MTVEVLTWCIYLIGAVCLLLSSRHSAWGIGGAAAAAAWLLGAWSLQWQADAMSAGLLGLLLCLMAGRRRE